MKQQVLIVSTVQAPDPELMAWMETTEDFEITWVQSDEKAIELFHAQPFDAVVVDRTGNEKIYKKLKAVLPILNNEVLVIAYNGETAERLDEKIVTAYERRKLLRMQRLLILDADAESGWSGLPAFSDN